MFDVRMFESIMALNGDNSITLSEAMGITPSAFSNKKTGKGSNEFTVENIQFFIDRWHLNGEQVISIFFADKVSV